MHDAETDRLSRSSPPRRGLFFYPSRLLAIVSLSLATLLTMPLWFWAMTAHGRGYFAAFQGYGFIFLASAATAAFLCLSLPITSVAKPRMWLLQRSVRDDLLQSKTDIASAENDAFQIFPPQLVGWMPFPGLLLYSALFFPLFITAQLALDGANPSQMIGLRFLIYQLVLLFVLCVIVLVSGDYSRIRNILPEHFCAVEIGPDRLNIKRYTRRTTFDHSSIVAHICDCNNRQLIVVLDDSSRSVTFGIYRDDWKNLREHLHYAKTRAKHSDQSPGD